MMAGKNSFSNERFEIKIGKYNGNDKLSSTVFSSAVRQFGSSQFGSSAVVRLGLGLGLG